MNWRNQVLQSFTPDVSQLILVNDLDNLLAEETLSHAIRAKGFELIVFEEPVAFRFAYESLYRSRLEQGEWINLVVLVRSKNFLASSLPYDLHKQGRILSFSLATLFPNLSDRVVKCLDSKDLDLLYEAQNKYLSEPLGEDSTKDFVLKYVFKIAPDLIQSPYDLLKILLERHYGKLYIPDILDARLIQILKATKQFKNWDLEHIVPNADAFFDFLREQWIDFVKSRLSKEKVSESAYPWLAPELDKQFFNESGVRAYMDNLFLEGYIQPITVSNLDRKALDIHSNKWLKVGIFIDPDVDYRQRLDGLIASLDNSLPDSEARYKDWLNFARRWGELIVLRYQTDLSKLPNINSDEPSYEERFQNLQDRVDSHFSNWIRSRYVELHSQPGLAMLHHIPRTLARRIEQSKFGKIALLVFDGMSQDQWIILREVLKTHNPQLEFQESTIFAWLPTITSVSRQAVFSGKAPLFFSDSIHSTAKEPKLWTQFWNSQNMPSVEIAYKKLEGELLQIDQLKEVICHPKLRALGLVIEKVDKIMHGMTLGIAGMHNQVRQWGEAGFVSSLIKQLLENKFEILITSDHGNIEAVGINRPSSTEGVTADLRGERVRVYTDPILRSNIKAEFRDAIDWMPEGLFPKNYFPLIAPGRSAFRPKHDRIVGHGGISIEELIVPLVWVKQEAS